MPGYPRYAIYFVPAPDSALYRFGSESIGYDAFTGEAVAFPPNVIARFPAWHGMTADARKYGFHATLKAPFALADRTTETELIRACAAFCAQPRDIASIELHVARIGGFVALVPTTHSPALTQLASDVVEAFDSFRSPLAPEDRERRNPSKLTERQVAYLDRWGYPYVWDEFRFHMTLTGGLEPTVSEAAKAMLSQRFSEAAIGAAAVDGIAIFRQDSATARFRVSDRYPLRGA